MIPTHRLWMPQRNGPSGWHRFWKLTFIHGLLSSWGRYLCLCGMIAGAGSIALACHHVGAADDERHFLICLSALWLISWSISSGYPTLLHAFQKPAAFSLVSAVSVPVLAHGSTLSEAG